VSVEDLSIVPEIDSDDDSDDERSVVSSPGAEIAGVAVSLEDT